MEASCVATDKTLVILKVQTKKEDTVKDNRIIAKTTEEIVSTAKTSISQALIKLITTVAKKVTIPKITGNWGLLLKLNYWNF